MRLSGSGRPASSLAPGATGTDLTLTGNGIAAIWRATTALEFPADAAAPRVRCTTDTTTGISRTAASTIGVFVGGVSYFSVLFGSVSIPGGCTIIGNLRRAVGGYRSAEPLATPISITAVGNSITAAQLDDAEELTIALPSGSIVSTATPMIADGLVTGQRIVVRGVTAGATWTLSDEGTVAGSNLRLGAATRAIGQRDSLELWWDGTDWCEEGFNNVL